MNGIIREVRKMTAAQRQAFESAIGEPLRDDQQVRIEVQPAAITDQDAFDKGDEPTELPDVPDWWKIYEGLSDEEIDRLDEAIRQRADLTRTFE